MAPRITVHPLDPADRTVLATIHPDGSVTGTADPALRRAIQCTGQGERARCFVSVYVRPAGQPVDLRRPADFARLLTYLKTTMADEEP